MAWGLQTPRSPRHQDGDPAVPARRSSSSACSCHGELAALKPAAALPDRLLPDDLAGRRRRRPVGRLRRARCSTLTSSWPRFGAAGGAGGRRAAHGAALRAGAGGRRWPASPAMSGAEQIDRCDDDARVLTRNFYGTLRVTDSAPTRVPPTRAAAHPRRHHARRAVPDARTPHASRPPITGRPPASAAVSGNCCLAWHRKVGRDRPRRRHDRGVRTQGRHLPLLRDQPAGHRARATEFTFLARPRRQSRPCWATRA